MAQHHIMQAITSERLAQGPYVAARGGVEPTTFHTEGTDHYHSTNHQWRAEAVGCPGLTRFLDALENILYSSRKISDDPFLVVHLDFSLFSHQLSNFTRIRSLDDPQCCIMPR